MLRRPITVLSITAEDVADFEDRRAERLEAQQAMRRGGPADQAAMLRDPRLHRITQGAHPGQPARGHAAGWEYDSAEEDEGLEFEEQEYDEDDEDEQDEQQLRRTILPPRGQPMLHHQQVVGSSAASYAGNDGRMDIDLAPNRENVRATPVAAGAPVTPGAPGGPEQNVNPNARVAPSPSDPPGDPRARIRVGRPRPTREERIGIAPPAPERRRRPPGQGQQQGGA
ncbi:hypothetical protein GQ53DRAFT_816479 [Thozetella sp. PMI_491]|nr:hypothetical protein GQ53DRAFT_816479 [Thozetella sp. PMI_491]